MKAERLERVGQPAAPPLFEEAGAHAGARVDETGLFAAVTWGGEHPLARLLRSRAKRRLARDARGAPGRVRMTKRRRKPAEEGTEGGKEEMDSTRRDVGSAPGATAASAAASARDLRLDTSGAMDDMTGGAQKSVTGTSVTRGEVTRAY